jgi:hypothetical protein
MADETLHHMSDGATAHESLRVLQFHDGVVKGRKRADVEMFDGDDFTRDIGQYSKRYKKIDRKNNWYDEVVTDPQGVVIHECHEPLNQHRRTTEGEPT